MGLVVMDRSTSGRWGVIRRDALPEERQRPALSPSPARASAENWFWGLCLSIALIVLVPFGLLGQVSQLDLGLPILLALLSITYSGAHLALLAKEGRKKLFSLTFWIFSYVWLGLVPLVQLATQDYPWPGGYDERVSAYALFIILVGFGAYDIGSWLGGVCYRRYGGRLVPYSFTLSKRRAYFLSVFAGVAAMVAIQQLGGFDVIVGATRYTLDQEADPEGSKAAGLIWGTLLRVPAYIALLTIWWIWLNRKTLLTQQWQKVRHITLLLTLLLLNLAVNNPISLNRFYLGTIIFSFVVITLRWNERRSFSLWVVGLVFALVVIFPYSDVFREENQNLNFAPVTTQLASNGDYDAFQQIANTVTFVSDDGITYGHQLLGALFFWVPRAVWPDKPVGSGQFVAENLGYSFTNLSSPLWAEAYINAGLVGVMAILLLYGLVTSLLQQRYVASTKTRGLFFIGGLVPILAGFQIFFLRGDLQNGIAYVVPMVGCYLLTARVIRAPSRTRHHYSG
jgi:hypothetical protein